VDALVPVLNTRLDVANLFKDSLVKAGTYDLLFLTYSGNFLNYAVDSLFKLPDTTVVTQERGPIFSLNVPPGTVLFSDTSNNLFDVKFARLVYTRITAGRIRFRVTSNLTESCIITYVMPSALKDGLPLTLTRKLPASPSNLQNVVLEEDIDLSQYRIDLRGRNNNDYNTIYFYFSVQLDPNMGAPTYSYGTKDIITIQNSFSEIIPYFASGIFETQTIKPTTEDEEPIDIFKNVLSGKFDLEKVKLDIRVENDFGADLQVVFRRLTANNGIDKPVNLTGDIIGKPLNLNRANQNYERFPPVDPGTYSISVDEQNSNADAFIEHQPRTIGFDADLIVNPLGNVSGTHDFVFSGTGLRAALDLSIPLSLTAAGFTLTDTTTFEVGEKNEDLDRVKGGYLNIHCKNYYPFKADVQISLLDGDSVFIVDLLESGSYIAAAVPDADGKVTVPVKSLLRAPVTPERIEQFYRARLAKVTLSFSTEGSAFRSIYSNQYTEIKMVGDFQYNVQVK
ncbi:MAG: hypothetical protein KDC37_00105, partial [Flavobacteriales bacterium]|nr:hypothetical protein [Flavobacteriales bacterium]